MLKILRVLDGDSVILAMSGRIEGEDLEKLSQLVDVERKNVVLDLKEVSLVGRDVVRFLARCEQNGVRLKDCPAYIRAWIASE